MSDNQNISANRITVWVGIVTSVITVVLTIWNSYTKGQIDATEENFKIRQLAFEEKLKERAASLEESKERTIRFTFIHDLFPDLMEKDETKKELTINLIRLSLTDEEAARLFTGLFNSANTQLQSAGTTGFDIINKEKSALQIASEKEREGFQNLISSKYDNAISSFEASEKAYPTYHNVYELSKLIKSRKQDLNDSNKRKQVFQQIVSNYSYGIPADLLAQIKEISTH